jgi:hypothetical protein
MGGVTRLKVWGFRFMCLLLLVTGSFSKIREVWLAPLSQHVSRSSKTSTSVKLP